MQWLPGLAGRSLVSLCFGVSFRLAALVAGASVVMTAAQGAAVTNIPYSDARFVLDALREDLWPEALRGRTSAQLQAAWPQWVLERDTVVRARVARGDEDSIAFLLLFGTSFTKAPRATARELSALVARPAEALASLRARIDDFVQGLASPGANERLQFAREVVVHAGLDPSGAAGAEQARRYLEERILAIGQAGADQLSTMLNEPGATSTIFRERGLSSDTTVTIDFGLERTLEALRIDGVSREGSIRRVAIVGPGLDFVNKQHGYDFYPQQTIQPFAVIDSLLRYGLASADQLHVVALDVSPRVVAHLEAARRRATAGTPYALVLPRPLDPAWAPPLVEYWNRLGNWIEQKTPSGPGGKPQTPVPPPSAGRVEVRSVQVRPDVVLATAPRDLNVVLQRIVPGAEDQRFDLLIATNVLLYYDVFEQSLAAVNVAAMLRPGGLFLTNTRIVELPGTPLSAVGHTDVIYTSLPGAGDTGDRIMWYQKP